MKSRAGAWIKNVGRWHGVIVKRRFLHLPEFLKNEETALLV